MSSAGAVHVQGIEDKSLTRLAGSGSFNIHILGNLRRGENGGGGGRTDMYIY
jgi:hypothetical protein